MEGKIELDRLKSITKWTEDERGQVIRWLASKIQKGVSEISAQDYAQKIIYVSCMSVSFLNADKTSIFHENER